MRRRVFIVCCLAIVLISQSLLTAIAAPQETTVTINGQQLHMDTKPVVKNGRTLVPLRAIFEALGLELQWDSATRTVNALKNGQLIISLPIDSYRARVNGRDVGLDVPAQLINNSTYIPVRFIAEATGSDVNWDPTTKTVAVRAKQELAFQNQFSEDFGSCNIDGWTFYGGDWSLYRGDLIIYPGGAGFKAVAKDTDFANFVYETLYQVHTSSKPSNAGLIFRVNNPSVGCDTYDGYYAGISVYNDTVILGKCTADGTWTEITSVPLENSFKYGGRLKVVANKSNIKVYVNDILHIDVEDSTYASGAIGARTYNAYTGYANFMAYELTGANQEEKTALGYNEVKFYGENTKKWATENAQNGVVFGPTDRIALNDQTLIDFANELTAGLDSDMEKAAAIYNWVRKNIYYDKDSYTRPEGVLYYNPIDVYTHKFTSCNGYSNLFATLMNISGIPCILVEGPTDYTKKSDYSGSHVWNEAYIDGRWRIFDSTWDSWNQYENSEFNPQLKWSEEYFDPTLATFTKDHKIRSYFIMTPTK